MMTIARYYMDYNATTPLSPAAKAALVAALDIVGNPSSVHKEGRLAKSAMQLARRDIAKFVNVDSDNIVFTSGASEAATTLLTPHYRMGRSPMTMSHLYIGATEHPCVASGGRFPQQRISVVGVDSDGIINLGDLEARLAQHDNSQGVALVAIQAANNETGVVQPITRIAEVVRHFGGVLVVDAVQYVGKLPFDAIKFGGDFFMISAHKIGGPKGIGAIISAGGLIAPEPLTKAGGQERGLRGGTEALPLIVAFGKATSDARQTVQQHLSIQGLRDFFEEKLSTLFPTAVIFGSRTKRLPNTSFFNIPGFEAETMQIALDLAGFAVSSGSACSSGKVGQSTVLKAMGVKENDRATRISIGADTSKRDIELLLEAITTVVKRKL